MDEGRVSKLLATWVTLNNELMTLTQEELEQLLKAETVGKNRLSFVNRIHARYSVLRSTNERKKLLGEK